VPVNVVAISGRIPRGGIVNTPQALCDLLSVHEEDKESFEELLRIFGFTFLDSGCWKNVYVSERFPDLVIKRATSPTRHCFAEVRNYKIAPPHIRPFLLPLLAYSARLQVQAFVEFHDCPATCLGYIPGMSDSGDNNHTHDAEGNLIIVDYGQDDQFYDCPEGEVR
jgi:hypothetical protein